MTNAEIAALFEELADLLEFQGANAFRVRAYRNGARAVRDLSESVATIVRDDKHRLEKVGGIGQSVAEKCATIVETGHLPALEELREQVPSGALTLLRVPGVGPKKAASLVKELQLASLDDLKAACEAGRVRHIKGFGERTERAILEGLAFAKTATDRIYWADADAIVQQLRDHLQKHSSVEKLEFAGSYRRGRETVGDLDILAVSNDAGAVMDYLHRFEEVADVIARGETKMSVRLRSDLQVDLRVVPARSFGAALQYFTGSKEHNVVLRGQAKKLGLKINEYGVFRINGERETHVAGETEEEVYATLDLPWFPPELREARQEFEWAAQGTLPELVDVSDIRGDLHMHTTATDGKATLEEMVQAAQKLGLSYIAITDHSQRVSMARGLDAKRLRQQWKQIDRLNNTLGRNFRVLKGIECDILEKGGMDLPNDVLAEADWVIASVHYGQKQPQNQITERILGALENPHVCVLGHPTGRLINRREPYQVDMDKVFEAARRHGKLLELNANPARLDLNDIHCATAKAYEIPIVISTDAHSTAGLAVMRYGVLPARRGGLTKRDVANTRTWPQLKKLIGKNQG